MNIHCKKCKTKILKNGVLYKMKGKKYKSPFAIHPYETIQELLTYQYEERLEQFKDKDITIVEAIKLNRIFPDTPVKFWTGLQKDYDDTVKRLNKEESE